MTKDGASLPVLEIDGASFSDLDGFAREFSRLLGHHRWHGGLDAFDDVLRGGFGTPEGGWILRWRNSESSRKALGHEAAARWLEQSLSTSHPSNRPRVRDRIDSARRGEGPTLFDEIVEIIRDHGAGGEQSADGIVLELR
jgi:hypothetical protein